MSECRSSESNFCDKLMTSATLGGIPEVIDARLQAYGTLNEGAVFFCPSISREAFGQGKAGLKDWGKENAKRIFMEEKLTREFGFFIVTGVSRTPSCHLKCWSSQEKSVKFTLNVSPSGVAPASVHLKGEAKESPCRGTWVTFPNDQSPVLTFSKFC
jgi:hypothetical protein